MQWMCGSCERVSLCVADMLLNRGHMQAKDCYTVPGTGCNVKSVCILQTSVLVGSLSPAPTLLFPKPQWSRAEGVSHSHCTAPVQSYSGGNCCQSSDFFSALGTLLLDNRVANAHTQWDFPFQAWRWKLLKYAVSAFNSNVVLWSSIITGSFLGEIRTTPQSCHGRLCCLEAIIW